MSTTFPDVHHLNSRDVDLAVARGDLQRLEHWVREFMKERQQVEDALHRWQDEKAELEDKVEVLESELYDDRETAAIGGEK